MVAEIEKQTQTIPGVRVEDVFRAVCYSHYESPWLSGAWHENWIDAKIDCVEHNMEAHPKFSQGWDE